MRSTPGYHPDPHQLHGSGVFTGMYPQAGELMWLETGKPKSMMDKLCNTTQVFLPTAPPAATLPDLAQLGTVAALTPLGIQQMWNSLNSLQLQQLQTLQLQQLPRLTVTLGQNGTTV
nr:hypothetical protein BaRGS_026518 [Batillaria attramentaria]